MNLIALPAFADNYIWMLHDGRSAIVVDPGDAAPVHAALDDQGLLLAGILVTHHHPDHVGGLQALRARLAGPVYGPAREAIPGPFEPLVDGQRISLLGASCSVIDAPGHTAGHIAYFRLDAGGTDAAPVPFCGDTLFSAGCGRLFEGTPAPMHASLAQLGALPGPTRVCCAHEYTLSNLRVAAAVEADNAEVTRHTAACQDLRARQRPTLPPTIALECEINPFMRCTAPGVEAAARSRGAANDDADEVLGVLRTRKNPF
jgi:hydroxyacylglutathione hydrolase